MTVSNERMNSRVKFFCFVQKQDRVASKQKGKKVKFAFCSSRRKYGDNDNERRYERKNDEEEFSHNQST